MSVKVRIVIFCKTATSTGSSLNVKFWSYLHGKAMDKSAFSTFFPQFTCHFSAVFGVVGASSILTHVLLTLTRRQKNAVSVRVLDFLRILNTFASFLLCHQRWLMVLHDQNCLWDCNKVRIQKPKIRMLSCYGNENHAHSSQIVNLGYAIQ